MKSKAILVTLAMMSAALAGCTGSDGVAEIDDETLQQLFDDNIQDFMNNTSVTVHQEIHYHNNTTVNNYETTNEYSNTTNVDGGEVVNNYENNYSSIGPGTGNGTFSGSILHGIDFEFTLAELWSEPEVEPGDRNNTYTTNWSYYDYFTNEYRNDTFTFNCFVYYLVGSANSSNISTYWDYDNYYEQAWEDQGYNSTMRDLFRSIAYDSELRFACDEEFIGYSDGNGNYNELIYTITVPQGFAFKCSTNMNSQLWFYDENTDNNSQNWYNPGHYFGWSAPTVLSDGIRVSCGDGDVSDKYFGNGEEISIEIWSNNLVVSLNYRLTFNYEIRPIVTME